MKNKFTQLVIAILVITLAGCAGNKNAKIEKLSDIQGKVIGALSSGISDQSYGDMVTSLIGAPAKEIIFYNRGGDVFAALKAGKIDAAPMHQFAADYLMKRNPELKTIPVEAKFEGGVIMAVRNEDLELKAMLDSAITILTESGKLKQLEEEWVTNLPAENEPTNTAVAKIEGAKTIYVGVSGDFPPLDYMAADGRPAGFNVAILSEIGTVLNVNFEFVSLETQARFAALSSKKIDVIFCHFQSNDSKYFDDLKTNNWISTKPYFTYKGGCFAVKK